MKRRSPLRSLLALLVTAGVTFAAVPALAGAPADLGAPGDESARTSFQHFARAWMDKVKKLEAENRKKPTVQATAQGTTTTYRGYGDDFSIELRPTGQAVAPYIGLLRYEERVYSCVKDTCSVASAVPVTEIFRMQNGRWIY
jgi:hypothetical protein